MRKLNAWRGLAAGAVLLAGGWAFGATPPAPIAAQASGGNATTRPDLADLIKRLGSNDSGERAAAQDALDKIDYESRDDLAKLADDETDSEVKARLTQRLEAMDEQLATNPPPITLHVKGASLLQITDALGKAMGLSFSASGGDRNAGYTLNFDKAPFWEVYAAIARQSPFQLIATQPSGIRSQLGLQSLRSYDLHGGFMAFVQALELTRTLDPQGSDAVAASRLMLSYAIAVDPRIKVIQASAPRIISALDDQGNELAPAAGQPGMTRGPIRVVSSVTSQSAWSGSQELRLPEKPGTKLAVVKGEGRFVVQVSVARGQIDNVEKHVNEPITVGSRTITIRQFNTANDRILLQISGTPPAPPDPLNGINAARIECTLFNGAGTKVWSGVLSTNSSVSLGGGQTGPFKLMVAVANKTKEVVVPFEFKDIPLP